MAAGLQKFTAWFVVGSYCYILHVGLEIIVEFGLQQSAHVCSFCYIFLLDNILFFS